jgi:hypothetical protein
LNKTTAIFTAAALSFATLSGAAFAQSAEVSVGMTVYGPQGGEVGTVDEIDGTTALVNTGTNVVALPIDKFATSEKGPVISVTKAQLNEIVEQAAAEAAAKLDVALVAGAAVVDSNGTALGTIGSIDGENVVLETEGGPVALTKAYFTVGTAGLTALVTAEQVAAALANS